MKNVMMEFGIPILAVGIALIFFMYEIVIPAAGKLGVIAKALGPIAGN